MPCDKNRHEIDITNMKMIEFYKIIRYYEREEEG